MTIPTGVNHRDFAIAAFKKGVKIQSKFPGVYMKMTGASISWTCRLQTPGKLYYKMFPFNEQGEINAGKEYLKFNAEAGIKPRYNGAKRKPYQK